MAIFSNKIFSSEFLDYPKNSIIEILYKEEDNIISYILEVDFNNDDFNDLLKEVSLEEIEKATLNEVTAKRDLINKEIEAAAKRLNIQKVDYSISSVLQYLNDNNEDDNVLFELKVYILENTVITNKTKKSAIRKCKTIKDILKIYYNL